MRVKQAQKSGLACYASIKDCMAAQCLPPLTKTGGIESGILLPVIEAFAGIPRTGHSEQLFENQDPGISVVSALSLALSQILAWLSR